MRTLFVLFLDFNLAFFTSFCRCALKVIITWVFPMTVARPPPSNSGLVGPPTRLGSEPALSCQTITIYLSTNISLEVPLLFWPHCNMLMKPTVDADQMSIPIVQVLTESANVRHSDLSSMQCASKTREQPCQHIQLDYYWHLENHSSILPHHRKPLVVVTNCQLLSLKSQS